MRFALSFAMVMASAAAARAQDLPATPRAVSERALGGIKLGRALPARFAQCEAAPPSAEELERWHGASTYLPHFYRVADASGFARLTAFEYCRDHKCIVTSIDLEREQSPPESAAAYCASPLPLSALRTTGGIALGDSLAKVKAKYGPASYDFHKDAAPYYFGYTRERSLWEAEFFDFSIDSHGTVVEIRIDDGITYD